MSLSVDALSLEALKSAGYVKAVLADSKNFLMTFWEIFFRKLLF